jgi:hypothetical protein
VKRIDIEFLVYEGEHFEIEFYYNDDGEVEIWDDFVNLTTDEQADFMARVQKLADSKPGTIHPKTIFNLEDTKVKIWAMKSGKNICCAVF